MTLLTDTQQTYRYVTGSYAVNLGFTAYEQQEHEQQELQSSNNKVAVELRRQDVYISASCVTLSMLWLHMLLWTWCESCKRALVRGSTGSK